MKRASMGAGQFKARCLALIDEVASSRRELIITKRGRALAKLGPVSVRRHDPCGPLIAFQGDLVSPVDVDWDAAR
jgi:antitoxin (DNA-binding transcriptional repressor) of toxin-antitoxin stability system